MVADRRAIVGRGDGRNAPLPGPRWKGADEGDGSQIFDVDDLGWAGMAA